MMPPPVLDTHAWVWWVHGDRRLPRGVADALDSLAPDARPVVADISLWEIATLVERGRLALPSPLETWLAKAADPRSVTIAPITPAVALEVSRLPATFHRDPADRLIVATCRALDRRIVTRDRPILRSRLVRRWSPQGADV